MNGGRIEYLDRIVPDPSTVSGRPMIKSAQISVEQVLDQLAENPDLDRLLRTYSALAREDVQAVFQYALALLVAPTQSTGGLAASPEEFYRRITQREDIREILSELAK